jgi:hypothetical protein
MKLEFIWDGDAINQKDQNKFESEFEIVLEENHVDSSSDNFKIHLIYNNKKQSVSYFVLDKNKNKVLTVSESPIFRGD